MHENIIRLIEAVEAITNKMNKMVNPPPKIYFNAKYNMFVIVSPHSV